jgi:hypothetical protein
MRAHAAILLLLVLPPAAAADTFNLHGFADLRAVHPPDEVSWLDGGLGKLRTGGRDRDPTGELTQIVLEPSLLITSEFSAFASLRYDADQRRRMDVLEAYVRYRPISTTPWRWSVRLGAFYPPISLENTDVGWTSPWTLTPSAINTWVGEEMRTLGAEGALEWRRAGGTLTLRAAIYEWNDPTGVVIAYRGWALDDRPTGLFDRVRLPDAFAVYRSRPIPLTTPEFKEIDNLPGYYVGAAWRGSDEIRVELLRYDNLADPAARHVARAWTTEFWSGGVSAPLGPYTFIGQAMTGTTAVDPSPSSHQVWEFHSAFLMLGRQVGVLRIAARAELFNTNYPVKPGDSLGKYSREHGHALTIAGSWEPHRRLRLTLEALRAKSFRVQRAFLGGNPDRNDLQIQLNARIYL